MTYYTTATYNGTFQGGLSAVQGGDLYLILPYFSSVFDESSIWTGFASGALSSIASSAFMGGSSYDANGKIAGSGIKGVAGALGMGQTTGTLAFGAIAGGAGAALTGGNFWQGAVTGLVVAGLNHTMHDAMDGNQPKPQQQKTAEQMLQEKLSKVKIGGSINGKDLNILDEDASKGIESITRVSETKFSIKATWKGRNFAGIKDNAYLTIEPNKSVTGDWGKLKNHTVKGYRITMYNTDPMTITVKNVDVKTWTYIVHNNSAVFQVTNKTLASWSLKE